MDNFTKYSLHSFLDINKQTSPMLTFIPFHKITTKLKRCIFSCHMFYKVSIKNIE